MRILVPYLGAVHPETVRVVHRTDSLLVDYVETPGTDGYWQALANMWAAGETFIVLEQDKVPEQGLLEEMWGCPEQWCTAKVPMRATTQAAPFPSLACTKFDAALMAEDPGLLEAVGTLDLGYGVKEWSRLDMAIGSLLISNGHQPHYHAGVVRHLHGDGATVPA